MLKTKSLLFLIVCISVLVGCKNQFEEIRLSNDIELRYQKAFEYYEKKDYQKAQYLLEDLIPVIRLTEKAEKVYFYYAYTHYHLANFSFASYYFKQFYSTFPSSSYGEEALYMSAQSYYKLSPDYKLTQEDTEKAIESFQLFANSFPDSERVSNCNEKIDVLRKKLEVKALEAAKGYFKRKHYRSATHTFKALLTEYPDTKELEFIRFMIIKSAFRYAQESILDKQVERFEETIGYYKSFMKKYSAGKYAQEAENIYETSILKIKKIRNE